VVADTRPLEAHNGSRQEMKLTHLDEEGRARMVDVGAKPDTGRQATAKGEVHMRPQTLALILEGGIPKGDVLAVAQIAGIMAAKRTPELIPMCHPLLLSAVEVNFETQEKMAERRSEGSAEGTACITITATVSTTGKTGVEMEALAAVSVAALTIYDMCKAVERTMRIQNVRLVRKSGGQSGEVVNE